MTVRFTSLPKGDREKTAIIAGVQEGESKQLTISPVHLRSPATNKEVREGREAGKVVTPSALGARLAGIENDQANAWHPFTAITSVAHSTGAAVLADSGYPSGLVAQGPGSVDLVNYNPANYDASALYARLKLVFTLAQIPNPPTKPKATDTPGVSLLSKTGSAEVWAFVRWSVSGLKIYKTTNLSSPSWTLIPSTSEEFVYNVHGIGSNDGWVIVSPDASNLPTDFRNNLDFANLPWLMRRHGDGVHAITLSYQSDAIYKFGYTSKNFRLHALTDRRFHVVSSAADLTASRAGSGDLVYSTATFASEGNFKTNCLHYRDVNNAVWVAIDLDLSALSTTGATAGNVPTYNGTNLVWQTPTGSTGMKIVDAAADLPSSPSTGDLVLVGASSTFYANSVSFYTGRVYRYTGSAWTLVSRPLSATDLSTGTVDDDRLPSDISQSKIGASAAEGRLLIAGSGTTANWHAANYVKGMADGTEFSGTNFIKHPIGTVFEIVGDFTIAGGNSHAGSYKQGERWRKTGASAVTKMTAAAPTSITAAMLDAGSATDGQVLTATGSNGGVAWEDVTNSVANGSVTAAKMNSGSATDGQVATADGSGNVVFEDVPSEVPDDMFICHLVNANKTVPDDWEVGHGVLNTNQSGSVTITRGTGSASVQRGRFGIITALSTNTITVTYIALHPQNIKFNSSKANYIIAIDAGGYVNSIQRLSYFHIGTGTPSAGNMPVIQSDGTSVAWETPPTTITMTPDLDDLWGGNSVHVFLPTAEGAPDDLRGAGFVFTQNNVQTVNMTSDSNRWRRARTATYGTLGTASNITTSAWEGWKKISLDDSPTDLNTAAAGRYVWYGGANQSHVPANAPFIGKASDGNYEASAADRVACAIIGEDYQIVAHGTSVLPIYNTGNSLSVRRKTGNTWGAWTRIKNTLTNALTALAGIPNVVSDPEQIPAGSTDWHLVVPHEAFVATKHPLAAGGGATNFYFCRFSTTAGTTIQFVYGVGESSTQAARRREATFTLAAGSWARFGRGIESYNSGNGRLTREDGTYEELLYVT